MIAARRCLIIRMRWFTAWTGVAMMVASLLLTQGCGNERRSEPLIGPLVMDEPLARGRRLFMRQCHQCHPGGEAGLGPALNNKPLPGFLIKLQVRQGFGAMPAFSEQRLTDGELDEVIAYLKALRRHS